MSEHEKSARPPAVSIGMPVFNGERHIREALDSLLLQTFTDFELIISDNASTDGTPAICSEYVARDPRIRYVRQGENRGYMANFRFVLLEAVGEYFMWAATDDYWDAGWLAAMVERLEPGVSIAFGAVVPFQDGGGYGSRMTLKSLRGPRTLRMLRYYLWTNSTCSKANIIYGLYHTAEIRKIAGRFLSQPDGRWGFDNILVFSMLQVGGLYVEPGVTFYKRSRPTVGLRPITGGMLLTLRSFGPYVLEHVRRSPPGFTRFAVLAVTPLKYGWQLWRGVRRVAILFATSLTRKRFRVGEI